jgi:hypothetical protein
MANKIKQPSFDEVLNTLRGYKFDVTPATGVANASSRTVRVSKYGCAALVAPAGSEGVGSTPAGGSASITVKGRAASAAGPDSNPVAAPVAVIGRAGVLVGEEIGLILDKGYQKFVKSAHAEVPATADHLRALHKFSEELRQATGNISLYNESLGTVSDEYMYDRVKGRTLPESQRPKPAWALPG